MEGKFISVNEIIARHIAETGAEDAINKANIIESVGEIVRRVKAHQALDKATIKLEVKDFKAELPCDAYALISVEHNTIGRLRRSTRHDHIAESKKVAKGVKFTRDSFLTYSIKYPFIYFNFDETQDDLWFTYWKLKTDTQGYPMIYDNEDLIRAIMAYLEFKSAKLKYHKQLIAFNEYQALEQRANGLIRYAKTTIGMPHMDEIVTLAAGWNQMIPNLSAHRNNYRSLQEKEIHS